MERGEGTVAVDEGEERDDRELGVLEDAADALGDAVDDAADAFAEALVDAAQAAGDADAAAGGAVAAVGGAAASAVGRAGKKQNQAVAKVEAWERLLPEDRERWWELEFSIRSINNVTSSSLTFFFCVSVLSEDPKTHPSRVRLATQFTPIFTLEKGEAATLDNPLVLYDRKSFALSYRELARHVVKVDMWQVSCWTFNTYYGHRKEKLADLSNRDPNMDLMMKRKFSKKQMADKSRKQAIGDVALFSCRASLEEIFDFKMICDNWTFELSEDHPDIEKLRKQRKRLTFVMPKDRRSLPGQGKVGGGGSSSYTTEWNKDLTKYFWDRCETFAFRGTRTHLQNSFFVLTVSTGNPPPVDSERLAKLAPARTLGRCLLNLTSVLDISVFNGRVKAFETDQKRYAVGVLSGNVKCILCSRGMRKDESDFRGVRPEQPKSSTTVSHLNKNERFLVVRIRKCENLPVADFDVGSSDPYLRVSWDNMVMTSGVIQMSVRPVFNQSFYFPVRTVFPQLKKEANQLKYEDSIFKYEVESKGKIKIEVWDEDVTSADFLGGTTLAIQDILAVRTSEKRSLIGKPAAEPEGEEVLVERKKAWFDDDRPVRVYDGGRTGLVGSTLANNAIALIHFEAYFYPDFSINMRLPPPETSGDAIDLWKKREAEFAAANERFQEHYALPFPDAIGAMKCKENPLAVKREPLRRFPCLAMHPQRLGMYPLMSFLTPIIIPQEYSTPASLLHWIYCLTFEVSTKQARRGLIPPEGWKDPDFILSRRRGAVQDHAVLLCSLLLGCKKDAYVCKGTVSAKGMGESSLEPDAVLEHVWVMTREDGWVTFWEPCSRQVFHLPRRYTAKKTMARRKKKKKGGRAAASAGDPGATEEGGGAEGLAVVDDDEEEEAVGQSAQSDWDGEVHDAVITTDDMDHLPTVGRQPKPKMRVQGRKKEKDQQEDLRQKLMAQRQKLEIAPNPDMLKSDTLVSWLPYDSIDVVFNHENLWANRQNHHPACILYDFPDPSEEVPADAPPAKWETLVRTPIPFAPIAANVSVAPKLRPSAVDNLKEDMRTEMVQNLLLYRSKKGFDCLFDHSEELMSQLDLFLNIQEMWLGVDPDNDRLQDLLAKPEANWSREERFILETLEARSWNKQGSPFFSDADTRYAAYRTDQEKRWQQLLQSIKTFTGKLNNFPTKRGKQFHGFSAHFSTSDHELIRSYLMDMPKYREFIDTKVEDVWYSIACHIYPLLGGCLSVWLYIGMHEPLPDESHGM
eukprot:TRINITY_DN1202_c0_g1_i1.p1 TRINITY_DN1202_c0_g1~~TRINITY_DN1202_c0_g1_i1.p1  ORF type:complete len:1308 (-),score=293.17 TRINITY_DN1202_c0_g1_i1:163-3918(-)